MFNSFTNQRISNYYHSFAQNTAEWAVMGQGTVSVRTSYVKETLNLVVSNKEAGAIGLDISHKDMTLWLTVNGEKMVLESLEKPELLLNAENENLPYWLSLDSNNQRIRYGKGEMLRALMLYEYSWQNESPVNLISKTLQHIQINGTN